MKNSPTPDSDADWAWNPAGKAFEDWEDWARRSLPELARTGRRGERHGTLPGPDGRDLFVKQYHHGGLLADEGDVYYRDDEPFRSELDCTLEARDANLPVPRPVGVLTARSERGVRGWYVSEYVDGIRFSRLMRDPEHRNGLAREAGSLLGRMHGAGLDHRDYQIKNLLKPRGGALVVLDFSPCRPATPGPFARALRLLRFHRSLTKYGFSGESWGNFLAGYRDQTGSDHPVVRGVLRPFTGTKHRAGDLAYALKGRPLEPIDVEKILVRAPNWVGDAVMSLPSLQSLQQQHPEATVDVVVRSGMADVYRASPVVRRVHTLSTKRWRWPEAVRKERYSAVAVLPKSLRTGIQAWLSGIPRRIGFGTQGRSWLLTDPVPLDNQDRSVHHARLHYRAMEPLVDEPDRLPVPSLELQPGSRQAARSMVEPPYLCFHPGAAYGPAKRWPADQFAVALQRLQDEQHGRLVAIGIEEERPRAEPILEQLDSDRVVDLIGRTTLSECMGVLAGAGGVLANDSGIMHLAAGLGTPTLGVFGSTDPNLTAPCGPRTLVVYEGVSCSPCFERRCPLEEDRYRCLTRVDPGAVADRLVSLIDRSGDPVHESGTFLRIRP